MARLLNFVYEFNDIETCDYLTPLYGVELDVNDNVIGYVSNPFTNEEEEDGSVSLD